MRKKDKRPNLVDKLLAGDNSVPDGKKNGDSSGWAYAKYNLDTDLPTFGPFADLVQLWRDKCDPLSMMPDRSDFSMRELLPWMGRIFIGQFQENPFNLKLTLWGTTLVQWWGVDYTNKYLGSLSENPSEWKNELAYFEEMSKSPFIGLAVGNLTLYDRGYVRVAAVDLPMSTDGKISHVLSAHMKLDSEQTIKEIFPNFDTIKP